MNDTDRAAFVAAIEGLRDIQDLLEQRICYVEARINRLESITQPAPTTGQPDTGRK